MNIEKLRATIRLRPTRIGFIVDPSDTLSVRKIMRYNTCLWGGKYNPIIPFSRDLPSAWQHEKIQRPSGPELARRYIKFFQPDVFIDATQMEISELGYEDDRIEFHQPRVTKLQDIFSTAETRKPEPCYGLSVLDIYARLFENTFQFQQRYEQTFTFFSPTHELDPFFEAVCGVFPENVNVISDAYRDIFRASKSEESLSTLIRLIRRELRSALGVTDYGLDVNAYDYTEPLIFVFDPKVPADLIDFWNLRITTRNMIPMHIDWFGEAALLVQKIIQQNHRPIPHNPSGLMTHTTVEFASSIPSERADEITHRHFGDMPKGSYAVKTWYTSIWFSHYDDVIAQPKPARVTAETKEAELLFADDELYAWYETLFPDFADTYGSPNNHARWVNVLNVNSHFHDNDLALSFPQKDRVFSDHKNHMLRRSLVSRDGIVLFQQYKRDKGLLQWAHGREAVIEWLCAAGINAKPSDAGITASELMRVVGHLRGVKLLADEETIRKLDNMAARRVAQCAGDGQPSTKEYPDRTAPVRDWQDLVNKRLSRSRFSRGIELKHFTRKNILRLGLAVPCSHCQKENWYSLDDLSESLKCARCLNSFEFPQGEINPHKTPWHYRVIGPFSVPDFAAGAYAVALTIRLFGEGLGTFDVKITYSTGIRMDIDGREVEADFVLWYQRERMFGEDDDTVTLFGEAKSFSENAFSDRDIERLKLIGTKFPGSFIALSCLKKTFNDDEKRLISELVEWGRIPDDTGRARMPVIILSGNELFFEWQLRDNWNKHHKAKTLIEPAYVRMTNLRELAGITQALYTDLPDYWRWREKYYKRRARQAVDDKGE